MKFLSMRRVFGVFAIAGILFFSCGKGSGKSGSAQDTLAVDSLDPMFMVEDLTKQISLSPDNYELYRRRSLAWYEAGNTQKAIADIDLAIRKNDKSPELWHLLGFYHTIQKQDSLALHFFMNSVNLGSENPETYFEIGNIHLGRKAYAEAEKWYNTAIIKDSLDPHYYFMVGYLYESKGDFSKAKSWYERSLSKDPAFIKSLAQLHDLYKDKFHDLKSAQEINGRILRADSLHPMGHFNEGKHYQDVAQSVTDSSKFEEYTMLMRLAISEYDIALRSDPGFVQAYNNRGVAAYYIDEFDQAIRDFTKVLELDPSNVVAHFYLGSIKEHFHEDAEALEHYKEALRLDPGLKEARQAVEVLSRRVKN